MKLATLLQFFLLPLYSLRAKLSPVVDFSDDDVRLQNVQHGDARRLRKSKKGSRFGGCEDPLGAVLKTMKCFEIEDVDCAKAGYDIGAFRMTHNGRDVTPNLNDPFYWLALFTTGQMHVRFEEEEVLGKNKVRIKYVETIYVMNEKFKQHEEAVIVVNDKCKIVKWDQTGPQEEQDLVQWAIQLTRCTLFGDCND